MTSRTSLESWDSEIEFWARSSMELNGVSDHSIPSFRQVAFQRNQILSLCVSVYKPAFIYLIVYVYLVSAMPVTPCRRKLFGLKISFESQIQIERTLGYFVGFLKRKLREADKNS